MQQFLIAIILVLGLSSYYLYNENKTLTTNNALLEGAVATQKDAIESLQNDFATQTQGFKHTITQSSNRTRDDKVP